jgi:hypothetical protein
VILHRDRYLLIIHIARGKNVGHLPFSSIPDPDILFGSDRKIYQTEIDTSNVPCNQLDRLYTKNKVNICNFGEEEKTKGKKKLYTERKKLTVTAIQNTEGYLLFLSIDSQSSDT